MAGQINIGDTWKNISAMNINIGDTWKSVVAAQVNIGDSWKTWWPTTPTYTVGDVALGGVIAYIYNSTDPGYVSGEQHGLVAQATDISSGSVWGTNVFIYNLGSTSKDPPDLAYRVLGMGKTNSERIVNAIGASAVAAKLCLDSTVSGYTDWFLPNYDEIYKLWENRVAIGNFNTTSYYQVANQYDTSTSFYQYFGASGYRGSAVKTSNKPVRAIRYF